MTFESTVYLLQQIGAILLSVLLIYHLHQWISGSNVRDESLYIILQETKHIREQAWDRSLKFLSGFDEENNPLPKPASIRIGWYGNKNPEMSVKYAVRTSNPVKKSESMPVTLTLKQDEKRVSNRVLAMDMDRKRK